MKEPVKASSMPAIKEKDKKAKPGKLKGAHIEVATNGYKLNSHHANEDGFPSYPEQQGTVHKGRKDLLQHLEGVLAKHEGAGSKKGPRPPVGSNMVQGPGKY